MEHSLCSKTLATVAVVSGGVASTARLRICRFVVLVGLAALLPIGASLRANDGEVRPPVTSADRLGPLALSPAEEQLLADARDGGWNEHSLFAAALMAGGAQAAEDLHARMEYALLVEQLHASIDKNAPSTELAEAALTVLHKHLLSGGYDLRATELHEVFRSGRFNCVSATVLYNCLAREAGLSVRAVKLPQHTQSMVLIGERQILVETTSADWFEAPQHRGQTSLAAKPTATAADSDSSDAAGEYRLISDVALVAMIYYNRGVEAMRQGDVQTAIRLNRLALILDSDNADARGNLLTAINKRALQLAASRHDEAAIDLFDAGLTIAPEHRSLIQNRALVRQRRRERLVDAAH